MSIFELFGIKNKAKETEESTIDSVLQSLNEIKTIQETGGVEEIKKQVSQSYVDPTVAFDGLSHADITNYNNMLTFPQVEWYFNTGNTDKFKNLYSEVEMDSLMTGLTGLDRPEGGWLDLDSRSLSKISPENLAEMPQVTGKQDLSEVKQVYKDFGYVGTNGKSPFEEFKLNNPSGWERFDNYVWNTNMVTLDGKKDLNLNISFNPMESYIVNPHSRIMKKSRTEEYRFGGNFEMGNESEEYGNDYFFANINDPSGNPTGYQIYGHPSASYTKKVEIGKQHLSLSEGKGAAPLESDEKYANEGSSYISSRYTGNLKFSDQTMNIRGQSQEGTFFSNLTEEFGLLDELENVMDVFTIEYGKPLYQEQSAVGTVPGKSEKTKDKKYTPRGIHIRDTETGKTFFLHKGDMEQFFQNIGVYDDN